MSAHRLVEVRPYGRLKVFVCECGWSTAPAHRTDAQQQFSDHGMPYRSLAELIADAELADREMARSWWNWVVQRDRAVLDGEGRRLERLEAEAA